MFNPVLIPRSVHSVLIPEPAVDSISGQYMSRVQHVVQCTVLLCYAGCTPGQEVQAVL